MAKRKTLAQKKRNETLKGWLFAGLVVAVALVVGVIFYRSSQSRSELGSDLCPKDGAKSVTVLLVDQTDPLSVPQRQDFLNQFEMLRDSIPKHGRLSIFKVDAADSALLEPVLNVCNPGDGSDLSEATGNPQGAKRKWESGFKAPVQDSFDVLVEASGAEKSPIFQSVQSVALTNFQTPVARDKPRRLIIVSDLLQNTPGMSFYGRLPDPDGLLSSAEFVKSKTDLTGVEVELWMLGRSSRAELQKMALIELWQKALTAQGARVVRVYTVSG